MSKPDFAPGYIVGVAPKVVGAFVEPHPGSMVTAGEYGRVHYVLASKDLKGPLYSMVHTMVQQASHVMAWTGRFGRQLFLNFDVAILSNRAQHLLALARKVEQGGLNG